MKTLLLTMMIVLTAQANALSINYGNAMKDGATTEVTLTEKEFKTIMTSSVAVCIKDGGSVVGYNKAWAKLNLKKRRCSDKGIDFIKSKFGIEAVKLKINQVPAKFIKR